jgi:MFS transporter, DHA1 family, multidrug resistance protein
MSGYLRRCSNLIIGFFMNFGFVRWAVVLGVLYAIGPFAVDMYLPALPEVGRSLRADPSAVQMSLTSYFLALGVSQIFYGPASDMWGRKRPLIAGMALFTLASIGCALATSMEMLTALRFVQGAGAAASLTLPRAIVRDRYTGEAAARLMALLMLVFSISPVLAPLVGSWFSEGLGWRSIFWFVTGAGVLGLGLIVWILPETRAPAQCVGSSMRGAMRSYASLLGDRHFMGLTLIGAFGMAGFFLYLANSSFLLIDHFGLIPRHYGYAFSLNAGAIIGAAQFTGMLTKRYGLVGVVRRCVLGFVLTMIALLLTNLWGVDRLDVLLALLFVGYSFLGLVVPITAVLALETHGQNAGTASALLGTFQLLVGGVLMGVVGLFFDGSARPMVVGIALCAMVTWVLARGTLDHNTPPHNQR